MAQQKSANSKRTLGHTTEISSIDCEEREIDCVRFLHIIMQPVARKVKPDAAMRCCVERKRLHFG